MPDVLNRRLTLAPLAVAVALLAVSCGSKSEEPEAAFTIPPGSSTLSLPASTTPQLVCDPETVTPPDVSEAPTVEVPEGEAPTELVTTDLVEGTGTEAQPGDTVAVEYAGVLYEDGTPFDASWDRGAEPFEFQLGAGMVIQGWDQGVAGMQVGGRRMLVIPAELGYGDAGSPPVIPGGATLVFVVDLLQVCSPDTGADAAADGTGTTVAADTSTP